MRKRIYDIARRLAEERVATLGGLAALCGMSERTIREDLKALDAELKGRGAEGLRFRRGGTVEVGEGFDAALPQLVKTDFYAYRLSSEERALVIAEMLVGHEGYLTLSGVAEALYVSRTTVIKDLPVVKELVAAGGLIVASHPSKGVKVDGLESVKRRFLCDLSRKMGEPVLAASMDARAREILSGDEAPDAGSNDSDLVGKTRYALLKEHEERMKVVRRVVSEQEVNHARWLTDDSSDFVASYLCVTIARISLGEHVEPQDAEENPWHLMARDILRYVGQYCGIEVNHDEVLALSVVLMSLQYRRSDASQNEAPLIQLVTHQFIEQISEEIGVDLNDDFALFENLANHLESTMLPVPVSYPDTPLIREVLSENDDVFRAVRRRDAILRGVAGRELTELEVGYIVLHICAAVERKASRGSAFRIALVCNAGVGTSQLLLARLGKHFEFHVVDTLSSHEVADLDAEAVDFVISTVPLESCPVDCVRVSPLLTEGDRKAIGAYLDQHRASLHVADRGQGGLPDIRGLIQALSMAVYDVAPDMAPTIMRRIRPVVRRYFDEHEEKKRGMFMPYLHQLLIPDHILLDVECATREDAIRASAQPLLRNGYIELRYIDAMIKATNELGAYSVLAKGFAMPHAGLDQGSLEVGMSFVRLARPVVFGAKENDPVEFACCLSAVDKKTHIKALFALLTLMGEESVRDRLRNARTAEEVASIFRQHEYNAVV